MAVCVIEKAEWSIYWNVSTYTTPAQTATHRHRDGMHTRTRAHARTHARTTPQHTFDVCGAKQAPENAVMFASYKFILPVTC